MFRRRGVVSRVPAFQPVGPGLIPGCVLCCVVSGGGSQSERPALSSVLVHSLLLPLQASDPLALGSKPLGCKSYIWEGVNKSERK